MGCTTLIVSQTVLPTKCHLLGQSQVRRRVDPGRVAQRACVHLIAKIDLRVVSRPANGQIKRKCACVQHVTGYEPSWLRCENSAICYSKKKEKKKKERRENNAERKRGWGRDGKDVKRIRVKIYENIRNK